MEYSVYIFGFEKRPYFDKPSLFGDQRGNLNSEYHNICFEKETDMHLFTCNFSYKVLHSRENSKGFENSEGTCPIP